MSRVQVDVVSLCVCVCGGRLLPDASAGGDSDLSQSNGARGSPRQCRQARTLPANLCNVFRERALHLGDTAAHWDWV